MRTVKIPYQLDIVKTDERLLKSTAERNKNAESPIGNYLNIRSPLVSELEPLTLPEFTRLPADYEEGTEEHDLTTPIEELIKPKLDLCRTPEQIEGWLRDNYWKSQRPMQYAGHEANTDDPALYDTADIRILIVRLSSYDSVNGSLTHGAIAQASRSAAEKHGFSVYVDHAYLPALNQDAIMMKEGKFPWFFGRTSRRHPKDFDLILMSCALTMETWNIIPGLIYSGVAPFKTMRKKDLPLRHPDADPVIIIGGVVGDFIESLYGKVAGEECVPDVTIVGDGEYTIPLTLELMSKCLKEGKTKAEFLRLGHDLPKDEHFERDTAGKGSWWYEPDLYAHEYALEDKPYEWVETQIIPDPETGRGIKDKIHHKRSSHYKKLVKIYRKPGNEYAADIGMIKRAVVRDLNDVRPWEETPIMYDGSLGPSADIQISSGCLCVSGDTYIETEFGFATIKEAYETSQEEGELGGIVVQTRRGLQSAEGIKYLGKKKVRKYTFRTEEGDKRLSIVCTPEHKFDTAIQGDAGADWQEARSINIGTEVWACDPELYEQAKAGSGRVNTKAQHYYANLVTLELEEIGPEYEDDVYDVYKCEISEFIANGMITHNSGGLCSFCLAEGTLVTCKGAQVKIESLEDNTCEDPDNRELDTPWGLQAPTGVVATGEKECLKITTQRGHTLILTPEHQVLTWRDRKIQLVEARTLVPGRDVAVLIASVTKDIVTKESGVRDFLYPPELRPKAQENKAKIAKNKIEDGGVATILTDEQKAWYTRLRKAHAYSDIIKSVEPAGVHRVYDVWEVPKGHVFYANGFVVSNCHTPETPIVMANGQVKPISEIEPGNAVLTARAEIRPVVRRYEREIDEEVVSWQIEGMNEPVRSTKNHKLPAIKKGQEPAHFPLTWADFTDTPIGELGLGDWVVGPASTLEKPELVPLTRYETEHYKGTVFNLEISAHATEEEHSYRVGRTEIPEEVQALWQELQALPEEERNQILLSEPVASV
jgi:hypothetical protein